MDRLPDITGSTSTPRARTESVESFRANRVRFPDPRIEATAPARTEEAPRDTEDISERRDMGDERLERREDARRDVANAREQRDARADRAEELDRSRRERRDGRAEPVERREPVARGDRTENDAKTSSADTNPRGVDEQLEGVRASRIPTTGADATGAKPTSESTGKPEEAASSKSSSDAKVNPGAKKGASSTADLTAAVPTPEQPQTAVIESASPTASSAHATSIGGDTAGLGGGLAGAVNQTLDAAGGMLPAAATPTNGTPVSVEATSTASSVSTTSANPDSRGDVAPGVAKPATHGAPAHVGPTPTNTITDAPRATEVEAPRPPEPPVPVYDVERAADILRQVRVHITPRVEEAHIQLHPAELGRMSIHVSIEDGRMKTVVRAEKREALAAIEAHLPELRASLRGQGIVAQDFQLSLGLDDQPRRDGGDRAGASRAGGSRSIEADESVTKNLLRATAKAASAGAVDLYA